jgi:pyrimidine oxygenase
MQKTIKSGLFLPVGNHGWVHSTNAPAAEDGSYPRVLKIVQEAERLGFDFVLSPAIWRGRKGPSRHWTHVLDSMTTTAALLQATTRITVMSTIHMTVFPPAVIAKMVATQDQIAPGRVGLNLVTGVSYLDLAHLGLWDDTYDHDERYDLGDEWVDVVKRFWTDDVIDVDGTFFRTEHGTMGPKPSVMPELVNAGASPRGFRFAVQNCQAGVIPASDDPKIIEVAREVKRIARELGRPGFKTYGVVGLVPGATDQEAQERLDLFNAGVDLEALDDIAEGYNQNRSVKALSESSKLGGGKEVSAVNPGTLVGSYETLGRRLATAVKDGDYDGLMVWLPDFVDDLPGLTQITAPVMAEHGVNWTMGQTTS